MRALIILLSATLLSGCMYQTLDYVEIKAANELCAQHGGVFEINAWFVGTPTLKCVDGQFFGERDLQIKLYQLKAMQAKEYNRSEG